MVKHGISSQNGPFGILDIKETLDRENVQLHIISSELKCIVASYPKIWDRKRFVLFGIEQVAGDQNHVNLCTKPNSALKKDYVLCIYCGKTMFRKSLYTRQHYARGCPAKDLKCLLCERPQLSENTNLPSTFLPYVCTSDITSMKLKKAIHCHNCGHDFYDKGRLVHVIRFIYSIVTYCLQNRLLHKTSDLDL